MNHNKGPLPVLRKTNKPTEYAETDRSSNDKSHYKELKRYTADLQRGRNFNFSQDDRKWITGINTAPVKSAFPSHGVKTLKVTGLQLKALPNYLFRMSDLENLHLSPERSACLDYKLARVPKEIGNLQKLHTLVLDTNELNTIPEEITLLTNLKLLTLSNNCLTELPLSFNKLQQLESLHMANNRLAHFPPDICDLQKLKFLDLADNSIQEIPSKISNLSNLNTLILYLNDIERLPDSFCSMWNLTTLWLGQNRLRYLPKAFGDLENLDWENDPCSANIDGNPLLIPPVAVCRNGAAAVAQYFRTKNTNKK